MHRSKVFGAGLLLMAGLNGQDLESEKSPNVLLIIIDDLRNELNCYGANYIKSPNIDQLANNGYLFNRAYVQHAVCSASRASFLTGCRPATVGVTYPYSEYFVNEFMPQYLTIPEFFEQQGYQVYTFGKIHHGSIGLDHLKTSHYSPTWLPLYALEENIRLGGESGRSRLQPPFEYADVPDEAYRDGAIAHEAVEIIKKVSGNDDPFFLAVGFMKPHLPFNAPKQYWDMYTREEVGLANNRKHPEGSPSYSTAHHALNKYAGPNDEGGKMVPEEYQITLRHGYAACVSFIDAQVGKLISQLSESGVLDNTIVMIISDHGWHLGEQQMWGKSTNFENSARAPLIISVPGKANGINLDQFVEYVDIYPTLQELTGFQVSDHLEGTSFVPLLRDPGKTWKEAAFSQHHRGTRLMGYAIRTDDFRYVEWRRNEDNYLMAVELYDHRIDPVESKNLASEEEYKDIVSDLSLQLELGWKAALPPGITNRSNNPVAPPPVPWDGKMRREGLQTSTTGEENLSINNCDKKETLDLKGLSNPDVTLETAFLFSNLKKIGQQGIIFGHHHASIFGQKWRHSGPEDEFKTDCFLSVGDHPGIFGFDFGRGTDIFKEHSEEIFRKGGIITFSWHCPNPVTGGGYRDMSGDPVNSILTNEKYLNIWKGELDKIADFFNGLYVDGVKVPVIFRPFHENTGSWFWWGRDNASSEQFVELWRLTADYMRIEKGVNNMLLAYSPSFTQYVEKDLIFETYPGDDYVDIIGIDSYNVQDELFQSLVIEGARAICEWTETNHKIPALTEIGIRRGLQNSSNGDWFMEGLLNRLKNDDIAKNLAYMMKWMNTTPESYWLPLSGQPNHQSFVNFYNDSETFFLSDLKNIYGL